MDFNTKCPYCKIGFDVICTSPDQLVHMDIIWSSESGLQRDCQDLEAIKPYIISNEKYGTKFSLTEEMQKKFQELNAEFHNDPSYFYKENIELEDLTVLIGEIVRYSDYMNGREVKSGISFENITALYVAGKNLAQIIEECTEVVDN
jgi:hypothetical protein